MFTPDPTTADPSLPYLGVNHAFRGLHDHPRFQTLLGEIGVETFVPSGSATRTRLRSLEA